MSRSSILPNISGPITNLKERRMSIPSSFGSGLTDSPTRYMQKSKDTGISELKKKLKILEDMQKSHEDQQAAIISKVNPLDKVL